MRKPDAAACPEEPCAERMLMSADGAFVPLVGGVWGDVKLLAIGQVEVQQAASPAGLPSVQTSQISYFARLSDAATFSDQASAEVRRRGLERARAVCAVQDGADWLGGLTDSHRADALRILDFAHAAQRLASIGELCVAAGHMLEATWLETRLHQLKHEGAASALAAVEQLYEELGQPEPMGEHVRSLRKRRVQMDSPAFQRAGWPIGSGMVERGHKLVLQARLKGAGMHWQPAQVNAMLALRQALCNERWDEAWQDQRRWNRQSRTAQRQRLHQARWQQRQPLPPPAAPVATAAASPKPPPASGRTPAQYRWGRSTISPRMLRQGGLAKK